LRRPDVAVADVGRLTVDTVEALRALRTAAPGTEIVLCYVDIAPPALDAAARAGITALVPASRGLDVLLRVLRRVANPVRRRPPLVVAHGAPGPCLDQVALGLVDAGVPLVLSSTVDGLDQAHWLRWHRGPLTAVLVDPGPEDWTVPAMLAAPAIVVHSTGPDL